MGTKINIDKTVIFQGEGSRFALKTIVGSVFIPELNKEVPFEYVWRPEPPDNIGENRFDYEVYPLAPWQEHPLPFKYSIYDTSFSEYNWPAKSRNQLFNDLMETIPIAEAITENRDFSNTTFKRSKNEDENYYFVGESGTIPRNQLYLLQLDMIHSKFFDTTIKFSIGKDCRLHLSQNFSTVILTGLFNKDQMISSLVNYDLEGNYIGHIDITVSNQPSKAILSSDFSALMTEKRIHTLTNDSKIVVHQITETGEVISTVENGQNLDLHECLYVKDNGERVE